MLQLLRLKKRRRDLLVEARDGLLFGIVVPTELKVEIKRLTARGAVLADIVAELKALAAHVQVCLDLLDTTQLWKGVVRYDWSTQTARGIHPAD